MKRERNREPVRYKVGDKVRFLFGVKYVNGVVSEIRGPIGVGSRWLYGVRFDLDPTCPPEMYIELPADEMERVTDAAPAPAT